MFPGTLKILRIKRLRNIGPNDKNYLSSIVHAFAADFYVTYS